MQGEMGGMAGDGTEGPAGPPGISTFDLKTISDQIKAEVLKEADSKLSQSKARKCHFKFQFISNEP